MGQRAKGGGTGSNQYKSNPAAVAGLQKTTADIAKEAGMSERSWRNRTKIGRGLGEKTRAVLDQVDLTEDKHRNFLNSTTQLDHLANICQKHSDEMAAATAERVANGEFKNTFDAYEEIKSEGEGDQGEEEPRSMAEVHDELMKARGGGEEGPPSITRIKRAGGMNYVVEWSDGGSNTVLRKKVLEHGYKKCEHCSGLGVKRKGR